MASVNELRRRVEELWEHRDTQVQDDPSAFFAIHEAIDLIDRGEVRVAEVRDGDIVVHEWLRKAILLLFQFQQLVICEAEPFTYNDKIPLKSDFAARGVRVVPGASARWGSYLAPGWC